MKRIVLLFLSALLTGVLRAELSWAAAYTMAYEKDVSPGSSHVSLYSAYYCSAAKSAELFGGAATVADVTKYLAANFAEGKSAISGTEGTALVVEQYLVGQYEFRRNLSGPLDISTDYLAVIFYENGIDTAIRVMGQDSGELADYGNALFNDNPAASDGPVGAWTKAVPEPTSGLLLFVGLGFLVLCRRKRPFSDRIVV